MLIRLSKKKDIEAAQRTLQLNIQSSTNQIGSSTVGFRGGNMSVDLYSNGSGEMWSAFEHIRDAKCPRYWNAFGIYDEASLQQQIIVEINIPIKGDTRLVSGYFAKDLQTGAIYLMHTGKVGGGRKGIGKKAFLKFAQTAPTHTTDREGNSHFDYLIGRVDSKQMANRIQRFVQRVKDFKEAARNNGEAFLSGMEESINEVRAYRRESSGRRTGHLNVDLDYISYHGDVVEALKCELEKHQSVGDQISNNILVDLLTTSNDAVTAIFEVKTSLRRQVLYTAIGQILTHSTKFTPATTRYLVIPNGNIADDISNCLNREQISIIRFGVEDDNVTLSDRVPNPFATNARKGKIARV
ncbi:hypothetical protein K3718_11190 [Leisingera aquaemixtae]|uniref:Uncharacterized protein n=1 Tax=Leisingera aquaemixtae TaxID=1396826 RepID=A0ABY5WF94_9RHOB|nr:hypothetical protein [Leisingera aquaemixtae]UWQ40133.1 hypothetical protein K3718_11190 [Leisingera aquaemixtae]